MAQNRRVGKSEAKERNLARRVFRLPFLSFLRTDIMQKLGSDFG
jgi:hypothetical protein